MKYIRTKDGRIYQVYDKVFEYKEDKRYQLIDSRFEISLNDVAKKADTIEELCDEFVVLNPCENNRPMLMTGLFVDTKRNLLLIHYAAEDKLNYEDYCFPNELPLDKADVYGAIWTDKGLVYVAKLNGKGELELL